MRSAKIKLSLEAHAPDHRRSSFNPVIPGDHPDPTILRVGGTFWASATSGEWSPQFPLFRSTDLVNWVLTGSVFPVQPAWAEGCFWAPELLYDEESKRFFVWYVGKKRGGPLCIAVATAAAAEGPYVDHGPLVCELDGSIDPCFARDEGGAPYLIWKEDGNAVRRPTPIWAQPLSEDMLRLTGEKTMLIVNDQPWEEGVVEGPYILRRRGWFYMFYAGNTCCGKECKYAEGVARAKRLLGPWEKFPDNPLIGADDRWRCPGHGTALHTRGKKGEPARDYLLYHAYPGEGTVYVGREAILEEITWPESGHGWPAIHAGQGAGAPSPAPPIHFADDFNTPSLASSWQWPVNTCPGVSLGVGSMSSGAGRLQLRIPPESSLAARRVESALIAIVNPAAVGYVAEVTLVPSEHPQPELWAGLVVVGDPFNTIGLGLDGDGEHAGGTLTLWERRGEMQSILWQTQLEGARPVQVRVGTAQTVHHLQFAYRLEGADWVDAGDVYDATDLPAWDRALRLGLLLEGPIGRAAVFERFRLDGVNQGEDGGNQG